jgi:hypothetical protein
VAVSLTSGIGSGEISGSATFVPMMESAHLWDRHDPPGFPSSDRACPGRILLQAQVRATPMIVVCESSQMARQVGFTEHDHVIQALLPNGADHPLHIGSLPGRSGRPSTCLMPIIQLVIHVSGSLGLK